jgi:hypothetical protein
MRWRTLLATTVTVIAEMVVWALKSVPDHPSPGQIGPQMWAARRQGARPAIFSPKQCQHPAGDADASNRAPRQRVRWAGHIPGLRIAGKVVRIWRSQWLC